jgi:IrrE N-terminal-like domain
MPSHRTSEYLPHGENLCAHLEQSEVLDSARWYMLPMIEWLVDNWDALLHEERLPLRNFGTSAAEALASSRRPPVSLKEIDDFKWLDTWSEWWSRHCVRSGSEGGLFPDLYIRRYRDQLEISTGAEPLLGIPDDIVFLSPNRSYSVDTFLTAETLFTVLGGAVQELRRRVPDSLRIERLAAEYSSLRSPDRFARRLPWLAGLVDNLHRWREVQNAVDKVLGKVSAGVRDQITDRERSTDLVVVGSAYVRLLYGAFSPTTTIEDVALLTGLVVDNYVPDASEWFLKLDVALDTSDVRQLSPGEQGSWLGEQACKLLAEDSDGWIDVQTVLASLEIGTTKIDLTDEEVRAVSVFGPTQRPHIFGNRRIRWGQSVEVERFTLAHELCHLILDREHGGELAIATGPWAPVTIEQRANAFAAAFLMPTWLLRDALNATGLSADSEEAIATISSRLRVSKSSLIDRLYNLGELTLDDRLRLRSIWFQASE